MKFKGFTQEELVVFALKPVCVSDTCSNYMIQLNIILKNDEK